MAAIANLATGKTVLISGVTGFVGTAVALEFLKNGYTVHATARSQEKADQWLSDHYVAKLNTKFFIVKDVVDKGAFDEAIKGVDVVAHTASPFHFNAPDPEKDMLIPAIEGTKSILESAAKEPSVKRVVITSSFAAILDMDKQPHVGHTYSHKDWNPATYEKAKTTDNPGYLYCASKSLAEKAAWDFVEQNKPSWSLSTVCPPMVFGPPSQHVASMDSLNTSSASLWSIISGDNKKEVPETSFPVGTDVRDIAKAHYLAGTVEAAKGQRYLTIAYHYSNDQIAALLSREYPDRASRIPASDGKPAPDHFGTDSSKAEKELGIKWIPFEQSIKDTAERLWQIEAGLKQQQK